MQSNRTICCIALLSCIALLCACVNAAFAADFIGSADHPLITRYPGSEITWHEVQDHSPYKIAVGPVTGYREIDDWVDVAGKLTRLNYVLNGDTAMYEVYANYLSAFKKAGFEILAEGFSKDSSVKGQLGHRGFLGVAFAANPFPPGSSRLLDGSSTSGGSGYIAAKLDRPQGTVYVVLATAQFTQDSIVTVADILEAQAMKDDLIVVDAEAMSKDIDNTGRTVLQGIFFDHDKATIKPESKPALDEIAKLLGQRDDLDAYVVGHTDMSGSLEHNLKLSKDRSQAVVDALVKDYAIAAGRLAAHGIGPLAPASSNKVDAGKASNRRVELVER